MLFWSHVFMLHLYSAGFFADGDGSGELSLSEKADPTDGDHVNKRELDVMVS
jgi:hypothetical protein